MRISRLAMIVGGLACLAVAGCVEQEMTVESDPPGALVFLNDQEVGRTPLTRDFRWYGDYEVRIQMEGYQTLKTHHRIRAPFWNWVPIDLLANLMPWTVRDSQHLSFKLTPADPTLDQPGTLLGRAEEMRGQLESSQFTRPPTPRNTTTRESKGPTTRPSTTGATVAPAK